MTAWYLPKQGQTFTDTTGRMFGTWRRWFEDLRDFGFVPVGSVVPHFSDLTGVPAIPTGWVECNGQTLDDPKSPLDGQTIPDLNGDNAYLRGNSTSGGTSTFGGSGTDRTYYDVVWVMRVR